MRNIAANFIVALLASTSLLLVGCEGDGNSEPKIVYVQSGSDSDNSSGSSESNELAAYSGYYSGSVTTKSGKNWDVLFNLFSPYNGTGCYLWVRQDDVSLLGCPPRFSGSTLTFSYDYGSGQGYLVTIRFSSPQSATVTVDKITGWESEDYPISGTITR